MKRAGILAIACMAAVLLGSCKLRKEPQPESSLVPVDDVWNRYTNFRVGFSMLLPKKAYAGGTAGPAPVVPIEDPKTGDVYIAMQYYDDRFAQPADAPDPAHLKETTLKMLRSDASLGPRFWHIRSAPLEDGRQIPEWIKQSFGRGCRLGELKLTDQPSMAAVVIQSDGKPLEESECLIHYGLFVRYSRPKRQLVYWTLGQDVGFLGDPLGNTVYDSEMLESFSLVDRFSSSNQALGNGA